MGAGLAGSSVYGTNVNQIQFGDRLQGLSPKATQFFIQSGRGGGNNYRARTAAPKRDFVFCMNQLSGVGASRSPYKIRGLNNPRGTGHCRPGKYYASRYLVSEAEMKAHGRMDNSHVDWFYLYNGNVYSAGKAGSAFWVTAKRLYPDAFPLNDDFDSWICGVVPMEQAIGPSSEGLISPEDAVVLLGLSTPVGKYIGTQTSLAVAAACLSPPPPPPTTMQLIVKTLTGNSISLSMSPTDTVRDVKQKIAEKEGVPVDQQSLVFAGTPLENDSILANVGIQDGSIIHLVL